MIPVKRQLQVYTFMVFAHRTHAGFKNVVMQLVADVMAKLAGSRWIVQPCLQGTPFSITPIGQQEFRSRRLIYWGIVPEDYLGKARWCHAKVVETEFKPPFQRFPDHRFTMACRPLCGMDLKRVHVTCWLHCGIRRAYYGLLPKVRELEAVWSIAPAMNRRNLVARERIMKRLALIVEWSGMS
jgi:hypothetical protein